MDRILEGWVGVGVSMTVSVTVRDSVRMKFVLNGLDRSKTDQITLSLPAGSGY